MNYQDILSIASKLLNCPVCGSKFDLENIHFRGFIDEKFVIQTACNNGHTPLNALFISAISKNTNESEPDLTPISDNDFLDLKLKLKKFDGNFENVFKPADGKTNFNSKNP